MDGPALLIVGEVAALAETAGSLHLADETGGISFGVGS
jgi:hypothetical protein